MLHIRDVEGPKKTGSVETRLEAMEQHVFKCQAMVEHGLNANHMMITEFTNNHKMDAIDIGKHLSRLYDRIDQLQGLIYDLQNQNCTPPWLNATTLTALTDHRRPETYSFHISLGEMTITLENIDMITGLPIEGRALIGKVRYDGWRQWVAALVGVEPELSTDETRKDPRPSGVLFSWVQKHFSKCP
ncbi:serine threonine-protein phosphatase 7 [Hordeum vulgare]|nr:serine threonine-protein phosphatase 7 [Hordeum vulgare]